MMTLKQNAEDAVHSISQWVPKSLKSQLIDLAPNMWLHSSVGRASHRYRGGHGFESRWSPDFFQPSSFQLLKLENLLRWSFFTFKLHVLHFFFLTFPFTFWTIFTIHSFHTFPSLSSFILCHFPLPCLLCLLSSSTTLPSLYLSFLSPSLSVTPTPSLSHLPFPTSLPLLFPSPTSLLYNAPTLSLAVTFSSFFNTSPPPSFSLILFTSPTPHKLFISR